MACCFLASSSSLFTASVAIASYRVCLSKSSLKVASNFRMVWSLSSISFSRVGCGLLLSPAPSLTIGISSSIFHLDLWHYASYLLNMRIPIVGANVKVGSLNNCPKDFKRGKNEERKLAEQGTKFGSNSAQSSTHRRGSWRLCVLHHEQTMPRHPLIKPRRGHQLCLSTHRHRSPRICVDHHPLAQEQALPCLDVLHA
ncbi:hypothetical protein PIB30_068442 [Stylosanthes scabra]|uniref:Secreted protein n=1 Tax=Stylosanthes scabra TaxID=79078 RepID=A0ABU6QMF6_9FABA|nr:hypothetical protein [Stylosanthes scabra]